MKRSYILGREASTDIPVADASVSRQHAEITMLPDGRLFVTDCNSSNGTFVIRKGAARRIHQEAVLESDSLRFGDVILRVPDLIDTLRRKSRGVAAASAAAPAERASASSPPRPPGKLYRCECGAVRSHGSPCPSCSQ